MKTIEQWQKEFAEAAKKRFPNKRWTDQDRLLPILRQLADVGGSIQVEQKIFKSRDHGHKDPNHRVAALLVDVLLLADKRGVDMDKELTKALKWFNKSNGKGIRT